MPNVLTAFEPKHRALWGRQTVRLRHTLHDNPLFSDAGLAALLDTIPRERIAINTMDDARGGHRLDSWSYCERGDRSGAEILAALRKGRIWINMTKINELDPRFAGILEGMFSEFGAHVPGFETFKRSMGLLISSPNAQVFYHMDVPGQALWQLRGKKRIYIYPPEEPFLAASDIENVVRGVTEEEIPYEPWFDEHAEIHDLEPGDMLHWKLNGPHRVVNADTMNVSLTTEHWTPEIRRSFAMNYGNGLLRQHVGWTPRSRALTGPAFWAKVGLTAAWRLAGMQKKSAYQRKTRYGIDPAAPGGLVSLQKMAAE